MHPSLWRNLRGSVAGALRFQTSFCSALLKSSGQSIQPPAILSLFSFPRPCQTKTMAVACSSSQKALESPFSHMEMFGVEHPVHGALKGRRRSKMKARKGSKVKTNSGVSLNSSTSVVTASSVITISKRKRVDVPKGKAKTSKAISSSAKVESPFQKAVVTSPESSLVLVDADSPSSLKTRRDSKVRSLSGIRTSSSTQTFGISSSKSAEQVDARWQKSTLQSRKPGSGIATSSSAHTGLSSTHSQSRAKKTSTSQSLLSLSNSEKSLKSAIISSAVSVRFNRAVTNINLPPHMRLPRRAFESSADGSGRGRGKAGTLSMADVARGLGKLQYKHVIVMSGAGISTPSGIPDFRTPGTGLYDNLQQYNIPEPTAIFDITYFLRNPKPFYVLAKELYPGKYTPNPVHYFVRLLQEKGILLRNYTQNIDGLERLAGITPGKLVEAHGSFVTASCTRCKTKQDNEAVKAAILNDKIPRCRYKYCMGMVKPDVVFFGEDLPQRFYSLQLPDFSHCDLLIVMGTSLEVEPFASLVSLSRFGVPRVLINREVVGPFRQQRKRTTDVAVMGDLVEGVRSLAEQAGWLPELEGLIGSGREKDEGGEPTPGSGVSEDKTAKGGSSTNTGSKMNGNDSTMGSSVSPGDSPWSRDSDKIFVREPIHSSAVEGELCSAVSAMSLHDSSTAKLKGDGSDRAHCTDRRGEDWSLEDIADLKSERKD